MRSFPLPVFALTLLLAAGSVTTARAGFLDDLGDRIEKRTQEKLDEKLGGATGSGSAATEEGPCDYKGPGWVVAEVKGGAPVCRKLGSGAIRDRAELDRINREVGLDASVPAPAVSSAPAAKTGMSDAAIVQGVLDATKGATGSGSPAALHKLGAPGDTAIANFYKSRKGYDQDANSWTHEAFVPLAPKAAPKTVAKKSATQKSPH